MSSYQRMRIGHVLAEFSQAAVLHLSVPESIDMDSISMDRAQAQALHSWLGQQLATQETKVCPECDGEKTVSYPCDDNTRYPCPECTEPTPAITALNREGEHQ